MKKLFARKKTSDSRCPETRLFPAKPLSTETQPCDLANCTDCEDVECNKDLFDQLVAWEQGQLSDKATLQFFQKLVDTGLAWKITGAVKRTAALLIRDGVIHR